MTPEEIVEVLAANGWTADIVKRSEVKDLVAVESSGLLKCVDGRPSDSPEMRGPKALGGIYAIASLRGVQTIEGLQEIVSEVKAAGHAPSVHGDGHAAAMGCGYFKLWSQGELPGLAPPEFTAEEGKQAVVDAGGTYETLIGEHLEESVMINLVSDTTLEPNADAQRFVVDAWITGKFGLDVPTYLTLAATTVKKLNGPLKARIIVPDPA